MTKQKQIFDPLAARMEKGKIVLNDYTVQCPNCQFIRVYTANKPTTRVKTAKFTCPKCHKRYNVMAHIIIRQKSILKGSRNVRTNISKVPPLEVKPEDRNISPIKKSLWDLPDNELLEIFRNFVGYIDEAGEIRRGESIPEPIDEITGEYKGIADYQLAFILEYRDNPNILCIWARGHGKTWVMAWIIQICMKYEADKFLYFSLTDVAYTVADWIYIWAQNQGYIVDRETVRAPKKISGRKSTYQKFTLINGARYEVHGIRTSSTLGYHGWNIIMDDIIDEQHKRLPHLQQALEMKWDHQYSKIRRIKLVMVNTRKFAGDFFDFMINQFEKKSKIYLEKKGSHAEKYVLYISHKSPYRGLQYSGYIEGYRKFLEALEFNRIIYDPLELIAPWFSPEDFEAMKAENLKAFYAEMVGNPRPLEGGNWQKEDLLFIPAYEPFDYEAAGIVVDPAWTITEESAQSGITIVGLKREMKEGRRQYTVFKSWGKKLKVKKWKDKKTREEHDGLLDFIQRQFDWLMVYFEHTRYLFVIFELASGGQVIVDIAKAEVDTYNFAGYIPDTDDEDFKWLKAILNPKVDKLDRIDSNLFDVIKNQDLDFIDSLEEGGLVFQILTFPDCDYYDQIDSLAIAVAFLRKLKTVSLSLTEKQKFLKDQTERHEQKIDDYEKRYGLKSLRKTNRQTIGRRSYF